MKYWNDYPVESFDLIEKIGDVTRPIPFLALNGGLTYLGSPFIVISNQTRARSTSPGIIGRLHEVLGD